MNETLLFGALGLIIGSLVSIFIQLVRIEHKL